MISFSPNAALTVSTGLMVCAFSATALTQTDFRSGGLSLVDGLYQREIEDRFDDRLPLRDQSKFAWNALKHAVFGQISPKVVIADQGWLFTTEEFQLPDLDFDFGEELDHALDILAGHGIQLIPVIVPDKARVYDDMLPHARMAQIEARYAVIQDMLVERGLPSIDVQSILSARRATAPTYMRTDTHWSPFGAELVAKEIAQALDDAVVSPAPYETTTLNGQAFDGDLTSFVDVGPYASVLGIKAESIDLATTVRTGASGSLFGDTDVPVALVGTSFSAREDFNFTGFVQQQTGLDVLNYATEGQGPFAPMRAFLASDTLRSSPPSIVVWELPERYISLKENP